MIELVGLVISLVSENMVLLKHFVLFLRGWPFSKKFQKLEKRRPILEVERARREHTMCPSKFFVGLTQKEKQS